MSTPNINDPQSGCNIEGATAICPMKQKRKNYKNNLIKCKTRTLISTMNVRTLRQEYKQEELSHLAGLYGISILGIVDHKMVHDDEINVKKVKDHILITTSAWRNDSGAANGGVGFLIDKHSEKKLSEIEPINKRILIFHFDGNPTTSIIVHYSPTEGSSDSEEHYSTLSNVISSIPPHNLLLVIGDFNAHLSQDDYSYSYHKHSNTNGQLMHELVEQHQLIVGNTSFCKKAGKLWTYISDMSGVKSQIDFILVNKKWKNSLKNCEAYSSFSSIGSDHRILSGEIKLSFRTKKAEPRKQLYDWSQLKNNNLQELYSITVKNCYAELCDESDDTTEKYSKFVKANDETAKHLITPKSSNQRKNISNHPEVVHQRLTAKSASSVFFNDPTPENHEHMQEEKKKLEDIYMKQQERNIQSLLNHAMQAKHDNKSKSSWKIINDVTNRKVAKKGIIKGKNKEERLNAWFTHFSNLLSTNDEQQNGITVTNVLQDPFTLEELCME